MKQTFRCTLSKIFDLRFCTRIFNIPLSFGTYMYIVLLHGGFHLFHLYVKIIKKNDIHRRLKYSYYGDPQLSRQNQKPHGKNKIPHGKTENLTAKTKYLSTKLKTSLQNQNLTAKPNTSQQKQNSLGFAVGICCCRGYLLLQ